MAEVVINYLAVLAAAALYMVIGGLGYSPLLFQKMWLKWANINMKDMKKMRFTAVQAMSMAAGMSLILAYVLAHFVDYAGATTVAGGLAAGFWIWLGFVATFTANDVFFQNGSPKVYALNNAYYLISLLLMGVVLAVWV